MMLIQIQLLLLLSLQNSKIEWLTPIKHDFGNIRRHVPVEVIFRFKNTSDHPVTIENVRINCGCISADWSNEPISPKQEGYIRLEFNASNKGYFLKKVSVWFKDLRKPQRLWVEGYVE